MSRTFTISSPPSAPLKNLTVASALDDPFWSCSATSPIASLTSDSLSRLTLTQSANRALRKDSKEGEGDEGDEGGGRRERAWEEGKERERAEVCEDNGGGSAKTRDTSLVGGTRAHRHVNFVSEEQVSIRTGRRPSVYDRLRDFPHPLLANPPSG